MPGGGFAGISGVESGKAAPLVGGPPGIELHTVVEELPSGAVGEMFPMVVMPVGVGMVPNAAAGAIAFSVMVGANAVVVAVVPGTDEESVFRNVDGAGMGAAVIEGDGNGGGANGCGAGMVEPGKSVVEDEAGCADSARNGVAAPPGYRRKRGNRRYGCCRRRGHRWRHSGCASHWRQ